MAWHFKFVLAFAMMGATFMGVCSASAQEVSPESSSQAPAKKARKAPPRIVELEELVVEGRIQKPEVFYVLGRAETRYSGLTEKKSFVDRIKTSVDENPF